MSTTTANLGLFKYNTIDDANVAFNIDDALNNNWDTLDTALNNVEALPDRTEKDGYILSVDNTELRWATTQNIRAVVTVAGSTGTTKWRMWSDGWCEQMGKVAASATKVGTAVTLTYPYVNANYHITLNIVAGATTAQDSLYLYYTRGITATGFEIYCPHKFTYMWYTCGYSA